MIGMPVGSRTVPWATALSLMNTIRICDREKLPVKLSSPDGCSVVQWARDAVVSEFLASDCTHLFWIDSDMEWTPNDFFTLVGFAASHDIIGAAYTFKQDPPAVFVNTPDTENYEINGHGNVRVDSLGLGFTIMKRECVEKLAATKPVIKDTLNGGEHREVFRVGRRANGNALGEDVAFMEDLAALGYQIWIDPRIDPGHVGQKTYRGNVADALGLQNLTKEK